VEQETSSPALKTIAVALAVTCVARWTYLHRVDFTPRDSGIAVLMRHATPPSYEIDASERAW